MYCGKCGTQVTADMSFCPNCGEKVEMLFQKQRTCDKKRKFNFKMLIAFTTILIVGLVSYFTIVNWSARIEGSYKSLSGDRVLELEQTDKEEGTFEIYDNGESIGDENKRYIKTWERDDDVLTMKYDKDTKLYFLIIDDGLIRIDDKNDEPPLSDYIAPEGDTFEYEIDEKRFFEDGTYEYEMGNFGTATGKYYREDNIIYCKKDAFSGSESKFGNYAVYPGDTEYTPQYYIYNDDHITIASSVYLKD